MKSHHENNKKKNNNNHGHQFKNTNNLHSENVELIHTVNKDDEGISTVITTTTPTTTTTQEQLHHVLVTATQQLSLIEQESITETNDNILSVKNALLPPESVVVVDCSVTAEQSNEEIIPKQQQQQQQQQQQPAAVEDQQQEQHDHDPLTRKERLETVLEQTFCDTTSKTAPDTFQEERIEESNLRQNPKRSQSDEKHSMDAVIVVHSSSQDDQIPDGSTPIIHGELITMTKEEDDDQKPSQEKASTTMIASHDTIPVADSTTTHNGVSPRINLFIKSNRMPSDFFNLARKLLITEYEMNLIGMETAIVVAVDTAHLLERSLYATICRVTTDHVDTTMEFRFDTGAPIRRSRICITIQRSTHYTQWLKENPSAFKKPSSGEE